MDETKVCSKSNTGTCPTKHEANGLKKGAKRDICVAAQRSNANARVGKNNKTSLIRALLPLFTRCGKRMGLARKLKV